MVALHQPNFFPWLGYFDKIVRADIFVVLDDVQFSKTGGTWSNRVQLLAGGQAKWLTLPIVRTYHGVRLIREMEIDNRQPWRRKLLQTLRSNYARAPFFNTVFPQIADLVANETPSLLDFNLHVLTTLCRLMEIETNKLVLGSSLQVTGRATDRLIAAVRAVGGTVYLCGGGAGGYQDDDAFTHAGLRLTYQNFVHPSYSQGDQGDTFVAGLSCLDALMHCGFAGTRQLIGKGQ
ncbi:MAG: WbqC family protein [Acidobacteriota bacterium]|nr:WbqC family protein [Acidobacteriota bacterium]